MLVELASKRISTGREGPQRHPAILALELLGRASCSIGDANHDSLYRRHILMLSTIGLRLAFRVVPPAIATPVGANCSWAIPCADGLDEGLRCRGGGFGHHDGLWDQIVDGKISMANWNSTQPSANTGGAAARSVSWRRPNGKHGVERVGCGPRSVASTSLVICDRSSGDFGSPLGQKDPRTTPPQSASWLICSTLGGNVLAVAAVLSKNVAMPFELVARREPGVQRISYLLKGGIPTVPRGVNW